MRNLWCICFGTWLCGLLAVSALAETYQMTDGVSISGEVVSFNENGMIVRQAGDKYSERILWTKLSQESLWKLIENPKIRPLAEPFLEVALDSKPKPAKVEIRAPEHLKRPEPRSLLGALFTSSVGLLVVLMVYVANFYAAYEVALHRAQPTALVCGVSAVLPVVGPILFLVMPASARRGRAEEEEEEEAAPTPAPTVPVSSSPGTSPSPAATRPFVPPSPAIPGLYRPSSAAPAASTPRAAAASASPDSDRPQKQVFQRGAFTFNRRFFETKFAGFLGVVPRDEVKHLELVISSARGQYVGQRIIKVTANELMLLSATGVATEEVMIPFSEIKEIVLQPKEG